MGCFGNLMHWISVECYYLRCPSVWMCARKRNKNRKIADKEREELERLNKNV